VELLNSDAIDYGGSGTGNLGGMMAQAVPSHGRPMSLSLTLPPLAIVVLQGRVDGAISVAEVRGEV
jgi:1,4-alpha-glucan branching enzyme